MDEYHRIYLAYYQLLFNIATAEKIQCRLLRNVKLNCQPPRLQCNNTFSACEIERRPRGASQQYATPIHGIFRENNETTYGDNIMLYDHDRTGTLYPLGASQNAGDNDFCITKQLLAEIECCHMGQTKPSITTTANGSRISRIILANKKPAYPPQQTRLKRHRQIPEKLKKTATTLQLSTLPRRSMLWDNLLHIQLAQHRQNCFDWKRWRHEIWRINLRGLWK
ncbi:hypothetical protein PZ739_24605 [Pseudomonas kermanshahensis]|uniref:hypothetical protein n=1 Tax=Pseudomonas kermanshahensis TaxID=2745482 RepID=UPI0023DC5BB0|nr:hypothetical protein [Pseudomonas kermanshahensis]WEL54971.1 hypothetical protein PZ739_24605 [Pseudomonas kermanshahensis]